MRTRIVAVVLAGAGVARAAIEGVAHNGTTGRPQAGIEVTLLKLEQGMTPVGTTRTDARGKFRFAQAVAADNLMLRAEFEGVAYTERVPSGARAGDISVTVYGAVEATASVPAPDQHVVLVEPAGEEMVVNESFLYNNQARPPVTYVASKRGTLRFFLLPGAKGIVQVSATGPAGMPLRSSADKTAEAGVYEVNFPIKPGESRIDLTYLVPYKPPQEFSVRNLYSGVMTRLAAPIGVTLAGEGLQSLGAEPKTKATIFDAGRGALARLTISGEGRLARSSEGEDGGGEDISVRPAAVDEKLVWILAIAAGILAVGFYGLYTAKPGAAPQRTGGGQQP